MIFGVILPHTLLFGGVKRFLEVGNVMVKRGHEFVIFTPEGIPVDWFPFNGHIEKLSELNRYSLDLLFITETDYLNELIASNTRLKVFWQISQKSIKAVIGFPEIHIFSNSSTTFHLSKRKYGITPIKVFGGINTELFYRKATLHNPSDPFTILVFGRLSRRKKGISILIRACERIYRRGYNVKLLLFDTPIDEMSKKLQKNFTCKLPFEFVLNHPVAENVKLFHRADVYLSAEHRTGWSNTSIEAMASGVPVIGTKSGTTDFLIDNETGLVVWRNSWSFTWALEKLIKSPDLQRRLASNGYAKIQEFTWEKVADKIERFVSDHDK